MKRQHRCPVGFGLLTLLACAVCGPTPAATGAQPTTRPHPENVGELVQLVVGRPNSPQTRAFGAKRLLELGSPEAQAALAKILAEGEPAAALAVARTVADAADAAPTALIEPLVALLGADAPDIREAAIDALVRYQNGQVARRVGEVAGKSGATLSCRLAAIEVLRRTAGEPEAVDALVALVDDPDQHIQAPVFEVLELLSQRRFRSKPAEVRRWWATHRDRPSGQRWRALLRDRETALLEKARQVRELKRRLRTALRELHDLSPEEARLARLQAYLTDVLPEVRATGASLVAAMVADRMTIPQPIVEALGALVDDASPEVRRAALAAIRDLRDPSLAPVLMARWPAEEEPDLREDLLGALGRLGNPAAIPFLIARVAQEPDPSQASLAASGLGVLAATNDEPGQRVSPAAEPLLSLFERLSLDEVHARERVVEAMAVIGDARFVPTFLALLDDEEAALRLAAVKGLTNVGDPQHLAAVVRRLEDEEVAVRAAAVEAVSQLGTELAHADALMARADPRNEPVEQVRTAAWEACLRILRDRPLAEQIAWSERINPDLDRTSAERLVALLYPIVKQASAGEATTVLAEANARLGSALARLDRHEEAAAARQQAFEFYSERKDPKALSVGTELALSLLAIRQPDRAVEFLSKLSANWPDADWGAAAEAVTEYLDRQLASEEFDAVIESADRLLGATPPLLNAEARVRITEMRARAAGVRAAEDDRRVRQWLSQLAGPEPQAAEAERNIRELGQRAVRPLAIALRELISSTRSTSAAGDDERHCVRLLKELSPDWQGFEPDASRDQKLAAVDMLLTPSTSQPSGQP